MSDTVVRPGCPTRVAVGKFFAGVIVDGIDTGAMAAGKAAEMTQDKQDPAGAVAEISPP